MTTLNEARKKIYDTFIAEYVTTTYFFDNEEAKPPAKTAWVRLTVRNVLSQQESLGPVGARKFDRAASIFVQIFTPLDQGTTEADNLATAIRTIFEGRTLTPEAIRIYAGSVQEIGEDGAYFQVNVEFPLSYTETR